MDAELREYKPKVETGGTLETSALGLSFRVQPVHVTSGLKLECTTAIGKVHWQSIQEKIPVKLKTSAKVTSEDGGGGGGGGSWCLFDCEPNGASPVSAIYSAKANLGIRSSSSMSMTKFKQFCEL